MQIELEPAELEVLIEGLDCYKTKVSFAKGGTYAEKTEKLKFAEAIELRLREVSGK